MPMAAKTSKKRGKKIKAKSSSKRKNRKSSSSSEKRYGAKIDMALIDNFITLQKIMVNFSEKFDALSNQISKLLELFEISAKSLAKKDLETDRDNKDIKRILGKLDSLSQQAGLIGKGLAIIHEAGSEKTTPIPPPQQKPQTPPKPQTLLSKPRTKEISR